jgi:LuxR family maltose regulon positive regulatory protein
MAGLSCAYQAAGHPDLSDATQKSLNDYVDHLEDPNYSMFANTSRVRLSIMQGQRKSALRLLQEALPDENMVWWLEVPAETYCRALISEGSSRNLEKAEEKLRRLLKLNQDNHNTCHVIQILPMLALTCKKRERVDEALTFLEQAVELAEPGGWIRPFVESGPPMADLLERLLEKNIAADFIQKLLAAFKGGVQPLVPEASGQAVPSWQPPAPRPPRPQPLIEPLTNRELDVLELLAQRFQNKEIAEKLFVSSETVKAHLKNIYQKLSVSKRREAVAKARELGILTP